jgi:soluble lytic murein transglycosylase-like protein
MAMLAPAQGRDVYTAQMDDGSLMFTDSPTMATGFQLLPRDWSPPERRRVNLQIYPRLDDWDGLLLDAGARHGVPVSLLKAVCLAESGMNPAAKSYAGAQGLMQLMPGTARDLGVSNVWDPAQNIDGGARYLRMMLDSFGSERLALAAYNAGPANVRKYQGVPPFEQTEHYVVKVMDLYDLFRHSRPIFPKMGSTPPSTESNP